MSGATERDEGSRNTCSKLFYHPVSTCVCGTSSQRILATYAGDDLGLNVWCGRGKRSDLAILGGREGKLHGRGVVIDF